MKKLTIEQKAKAYDEAIERANSLLSGNQLGNAWIYKLLPELKESDDERIRKSLLAFLDEVFHLGKNADFDKWSKADCADWSFWLENQDNKIPEECVFRPLAGCSIEDAAMQAIYQQGVLAEKIVLAFNGAYIPVEKKTLNEVVQDYYSWLKKQSDKDRLIQELGEYKVKYTQEVLEKALNMNNKNDERLRKTTIAFLKEFADKGYENAVECMDWLEKQGEHANFRNAIQVGDKVTRNEDGVLVNLSQLKRVAKPSEKQGEQEPAYKVEPKFHEGEWITNGDYTWKIVEVKSLDYILQSQDGNIVDDTISHVDEQFHSFTIEDAKEGNVLMWDNGRYIILFKEIKDNIVAHCSYNTHSKHFGFSSNYDTRFDCILNFRPATKEQCDALMKAMADAGYGWDSEKKELKKIEQKPIEWHREDEQNLNACLGYIPDEFLRRWLTDTIHVKYDNPAWSEEDELNLKQAIYVCHQNEYTAVENWLKHFKDKIIPQPKQEWKQENTDDLTDFENAMMHIGGSFFGQHAGLDPNDTNAIKEQANLLLKLVPTKEWSKEDERNLNDAILFIETGTYSLDKDNLINWLKSVRPQQWKPSEEQIKALAYAVFDTQSYSYHKNLSSLEQQLKKLREE